MTGSICNEAIHPIVENFGIWQISSFYCFIRLVYDLRYLYHFVVTLLFGFYCGCRGFCCRTESVSNFLSCYLSPCKFFLVHLSRRLKCTIVIMCCPSSVVRRPSVVRPSSLTFHIFDFSSETAEQNLTKLYRKVDLNVLYRVCVFRADRKNKMAALASDWLRHFRLLL